MKESDMALETLKGLTQIGGFNIVRVKPPEMSWDDFDRLRDEFPINITERMNTISFRIQNGPVNEVGINGCQVDTLIHTARIMIQNMNEKFPCRQNELAIEGLNDALGWLEERKWDREKRGVEGTSQA
jgi:hypothetical protein